MQTFSNKPASGGTFVLAFSCFAPSSYKDTPLAGGSLPSLSPPPLLWRQCSAKQNFILPRFQAQSTPEFSTLFALGWFRGLDVTPMDVPNSEYPGLFTHQTFPEAGRHKFLKRAATPPPLPRPPLLKGQCPRPNSSGSLKPVPCWPHNFWCVVFLTSKAAQGEPIRRSYVVLPPHFFPIFPFLIPTCRS